MHSDILQAESSKAGLWVFTALPWCCRRAIKARGEYQETVGDVSLASRRRNAAVEVESGRVNSGQ